MKILKFGGSSVGSVERIRGVIAIVAERVAKGEKVCVVVSAFEKVTNELLAITELACKRSPEVEARFKALEERHLQIAAGLVPAQQQSEVVLQIKLWTNEIWDLIRGTALVGEVSLRTKDQIMSFGERASAFIIAKALSAAGTSAEFLDARDVIVTNDHFGSARVDFEKTNQLISQYLAEHTATQIVTGFIARSHSGITTTLGRGGSDYTAAIFGAALFAAEIEIWTDVDGMMTADPRKVPKAFLLPEITYEEALELCHSGAKVVYPPTLLPALAKRIPVRVRNSFRPNLPGTLVSSQASEHQFPITGIASLSEVTLLRAQGSGLTGLADVAGRLFSSLARAQVTVILISQASSGHSICVAVSPQQAELAKSAIESEFELERRSKLVEDVVIESGFSVLAIVGENMRRTPGISAKLFRALARNGINVIAIAQGSSELNISVVIRHQDEEKALVAVHEEFFLDETKTLNLFLVGSGLIGTTLLKQLEGHAKNLLEQSINIRLVGLVNSRQMVIEHDGLALSKAKALLEKSEKKSDLAQFVTEMIALNLPNSIFIDCSASEQVVNHYLPILNASIALVTPNKKAQSGKLDHYLELKRKARKRGVEFLYETSVGAGLPVISTLNDLSRSGDKIIKIEAVLSGTISFIFNTFCADGLNNKRCFSEIVAEAKTRGFTEPDPRDDLNGLDAARKLLILARESGLALEMADIKIDALLPQKLFAAPSVEQFMQELPSVDKDFAARRQAAAAKGNKLCFLALLEDGKASLKLHEVNSDHPFYGLSGSDNIISFTTERYHERPLVVKGPGAGAEVTAAGIFADVVRIANYGR